jgi:hypothetical protein
VYGSRPEQPEMKVTQTPIHGGGLPGLKVIGVKYDDDQSVYVTTLEQRIHGEPNIEKTLHLTYDELLNLKRVKYPDLPKNHEIVDIDRYNISLAIPFTISYESTNNFDYWSDMPLLVEDCSYFPTEASGTPDPRG